MALQPTVLAPHSSGPQEKPPVAGAQVLPLLAVWQSGRCLSLPCTVQYRPALCRAPACLALEQDAYYCTYRGRRRYLVLPQFRAPYRPPAYTAYSVWRCTGPP